MSRPDRFPAEQTTPRGFMTDRFGAPRTRSDSRAPCVVDASSLRRLVDENADGIVVIDGGGQVVFANPAAASLFGRPASELLGVPIGSPLINDEFAEIDIQRPDGSIRVAEMRSVQTRWTGGPGQIISLRDVTERRSLETQLRQSQKMEALGRLAGGISHDFNNMLTSILCECSVLAEQIDETDPRRRAVDQIAQTTAQAADLVRQLLTFSRRRVVRHHPIEVLSVARSMDRMLRRLIGESIQFNFRESRSEMWTEMEHSSLEQIILNLVLNARDAMPSGGTLDLEVDAVDETHAGRPREWVSITVRDTGLGMSDDVQARLFEPFFTTKGELGGSGLGLSVVYGIVKQAHGRIAVQSETGRGSVFQVLLPRQDAPAHPAITRVAAPPARRVEPRPISIALVEDEAAVRETVADILDRGGNTLLVASDGAEALERLLSCDRPPDVLITDVSMPRMSGPKLASALRERWPALPILFLSGYPQDESLYAQLSDAHVAFLAKPFTAAQLQQATADLLAQRVAASASLVGALGTT